MTTRWRCLCKDMYTVKNFYGRLVDGSTAIRRRFASLPTHALSVKYLFICTSLKRKKWGANHTKNIALGFSKPVYILLCIHNVSNCNFQTHSCRLLINSTQQIFLATIIIEFILKCTMYVSTFSMLDNYVCQSTKYCNSKICKQMKKHSNQQFSLISSHSSS